MSTRPERSRRTEEPKTNNVLSQWNADERRKRGNLCSDQQSPYNLEMSLFLKKLPMLFLRGRRALIPNGNTQWKYVGRIDWELIFPMNCLRRQCCRWTGPSRRTRRPNRRSRHTFSISSSFQRVHPWPTRGTQRVNSTVERRGRKHRGYLHIFLQIFWRCCATDPRRRKQTGLVPPASNHFGGESLRLSFETDPSPERERETRKTEISNRTMSRLSRDRRRATTKGQARPENEILSFIQSASTCNKISTFVLFKVSPLWNLLLGFDVSAKNHFLSMTAPTLKSFSKKIKWIVDTAQYSQIGSWNYKWSGVQYKHDLNGKSARGCCHDNHLPVTIHGFVYVRGCYSIDLFEQRPIHTLAILTRFRKIHTHFTLRVKLPEIWTKKGTRPA